MSLAADRELRGQNAALPALAAFLATAMCMSDLYIVLITFAGAHWDLDGEANKIDYAR
jgi:hypothetical protein